MLTIIIKRSPDPNTNLMTELNMTKALWDVKDGGEVLLVDSWGEGLRKVNTEYVCLVECDCTLSSNYLSSNYNLMLKTIGSSKGGGYNKLAMISSCVGVKAFDNRIYNYRLEKIEKPGEGFINGKEWSMQDWHIAPYRKKLDMKLYNVQIGFVPGAIIRMSSLKSALEDVDWNIKSLIELSTWLSLHFWGTGRRIEINPNTTYVSNEDYLEVPVMLKVPVPEGIDSLFRREAL